MSETLHTRWPLPASLNPLRGIEEPLFIQARIGQHAAVAAVASEEQIGAVYTAATKKGQVATARSTITAAIREHRRIAGPSAGVLLDAARYSGQSRAYGAASISADWIDFQLTELGLPGALTDSGFVNDGDQGQLQAVLEASARLAAGKNVIANLAIDSKWLFRRADVVRRLIEKYEVPVAISLGHRGDPLGSIKAVKGLLHVLESEIPVALLRSDLSAVGAIAGGASLGAVGVSSGLRHIFPVVEKKGSAPRTEYESLIVAPALRWGRQDKIADAVALSPTELHWLCNCTHCGNLRIDGLISASAIYRHNLACAAQIVRDVIGADREASLRSWSGRCLSAQFINFDIEASTNGNWDQPSYIGAWISATHVNTVGVPIGTR